MRSRRPSTEPRSSRITRLWEVKHRAEAVLAALEQEDPSNRLATAAAASRGQSPVFATLMVHADAMLARIRAGQAVERSSSVRRQAAEPIAGRNDGSSAQPRDEPPIADA